MQVAHYLLIFSNLKRSLVWMATQAQVLNHELDHGRFAEDNKERFVLLDVLHARERGL